MFNADAPGIEGLVESLLLGRQIGISGLFIGSMEWEARDVGEFAELRINGRLGDDLRSQPLSGFVGGSLTLIG